MDFVTLHASCVAVQGKGVLIIGASGSGKSSLALQLMAFGADLIADDCTKLMRVGPDVVAKSPANIANMIEARGIGILNATAAPQTKITCVVDMDNAEQDRLPIPRFYPLLGLEIPLLHKVENTAFAAALLQFLKAGRQNTP